LRWSTLAEWYDAAITLGHRRASALNTRRKALHVEVLPLPLIAQCNDDQVLRRCRMLLCSSPPPFGQPRRGQRKDAPHTALIVATNNRLTQIERQRDLDSMPDGHNSVQRESAGRRH
jgi:hypothetical protein